MAVDYRASVARVEVTTPSGAVGRGTAFLVAPSLALTSYHVVADRTAATGEAAGEIKLHFVDGPVEAMLVDGDPIADWAVLECRSPPGAPILPIGSVDGRRVDRDHVRWRSHGYPELKADGIDATGHITGTAVRLQERNTLQLFCEQAGAARGAILRGLSGGPVVVDGVAVGIMRYALMDEEARTEGGTCFACPIDDVVASSTTALPPLVRVEAAPVEARADRRLGLLLEKVRRFWIDGVLERRASVVVDVVSVPDSSAVEKSFDDVAATGDDAEGASLLILGAAGSGKTIAALRHTRSLIERAERDPKAPVPVVFQLSTWDPGRSIADWLRSELSEKYQVPQSIGAAWLDEGSLIPVLDGLDEVRDEHRSACVEGINQLLRDVGPPSLVVCCRPAEYDALDTKLAVERAVRLQPLTDEDIEKRIVATGSESDALRTLLEEDEELRDLVRSPFLLNVVIETHGEVHGDASTVIADFVDRIVDASLRPHLEWLASQMSSRSQTIFLIEMLQPSWLARAWQRTLHWVLVALVVAPIAAASTWLFWSSVATISAYAAKSVSDQFASTLLQFTAWFLVVGLLDRFLPPRALLKIPSYLAAWVLIGMGGSGVELISGFVVSVYLGLLGQRGRVLSDIHPVEALGSSASRALKGGVFGLVAGILAGIIFRYGWDSEPNLALKGVAGVGGWAIAVGATTLLGAEIGALLGGLDPQVSPAKVVPNHGIKLSIRNAMLAGLTSGPMVALTSFVMFAAIQYGDTGRPLIDGVWLAIGSGGLMFVNAAFWFGALDVVKHYVLRVVLAVTKQAPFRIAEVLDRGVRSGALQRVGSGYMFAHRLILESLATRPDGADQTSPGS